MTELKTILDMDTPEFQEMICEFFNTSSEADKREVSWFYYLKSLSTYSDKDLDVLSKKLDFMKIFISRFKKWYQDRTGNELSDIQKFLDRLKSCVEIANEAKKKAREAGEAEKKAREAGEAEKKASEAGEAEKKAREAADILDQNINVADGGLPVYFVGPDTKLGKGAFKTVFSTKVFSTNHEKADVFTVPSTLSVDNLVIGSTHSPNSTILEDEKAKKEFIKEMHMFNTFIKLELSPKVYFVKFTHADSGKIIQYTLDDFLKNFYSSEPVNVDKIPQNVYYLAERLQCNKDIVRHYANNFTKMLEDIKTFISTKLLKSGYVNTDIKHQNLCVDSNGDIKMIDTDPYFIYQKNPNIDDHTYTTYMLFQVFIILYDSNYIDVNHFFTKKDLTDMLYKLLTFRITSEHYDPVEALIHYSIESERQRYKIEMDIKEEYRKTRNYMDAAKFGIDQILAAMGIKEIIRTGETERKDREAKEDVDGRAKKASEKKGGRKTNRQRNAKNKFYGMLTNKETEAPPQKGGRKTRSRRRQGTRKKLS